MFSTVSVCLSVCLLTGLLKTTDQTNLYTEWLDIIHGRID